MKIRETSLSTLLFPMRLLVCCSGSPTPYVVSEEISPDSSLEPLGGDAPRERLR